MAVKISMPKLSDTMKEGKLIKWHKQEGDEVKPGDVIAEVETDKANMDLEAFDKGTLLKLFVKENDRVPVGAVLAIVGDRKESIDDLVGEIESSRDAPPVAAVPHTAQATAAATAATPHIPAPVSARPLAKPAPSVDPVRLGLAAGGLRASPMAAKMAAEHGIPLESIQGSGPGGRIVKNDIDLILSQGLAQRLPDRRRGGTPPAIEIQNKLAETLTPLEGVRKVIAERMALAKQSIPHFYLQAKLRMDRVVGFRMALNSGQTSAGGVAPLSYSYNDFILQGVCKALMMNPGVNATFDGIGVHTHAQIDLSFAVAFEGGLITPVIRGCDALSLRDIHMAAEDLVDRGRRMKLKPEEYLGGSFTVSNLGMFGLDNFQPIINPPQVAILAVAAIQRQPCVDDEGHLYVGWEMGVTLACDHRAIDGAAGARFLKDLTALMEQPESWVQ